MVRELENTIRLIIFLCEIPRIQEINIRVWYMPRHKWRRNNTKGPAQSLGAVERDLGERVVSWLATVVGKHVITSSDSVWRQSREWDSNFSCLYYASDLVSERALECMMSNIIIIQRALILEKSKKDESSTHWMNKKWNA